MNTNTPRVNPRAVNHPNHPHALNDRERAAQAVAMRTAGHTVQQIADALGYHDTSATSRAIQRSIGRVESETADEYRTILSARLEDVFRRAMDDLDRAATGREVGRAALYNAALRACDSLARLHGIDRPVAPVGAPSDAPTRIRDDVDLELHRLASAIRGHYSAEAADRGLPAPAMPILDAIVEDTSPLDSGDTGEAE